jgi:hypothetical protein
MFASMISSLIDTPLGLASALSQTLDQTGEARQGQTLLPTWPLRELQMSCKGVYTKLTHLSQMSNVPEDVAP